MEPVEVELLLQFESIFPTLARIGVDGGELLGLVGLSGDARIEDDKPLRMEEVC
jgi:hypothetical protein